MEDCPGKRAVRTAVSTRTAKTGAKLGDGKRITRDTDTSVQSVFCLSGARTTKKESRPTQLYRAAGDGRQPAGLCVQYIHQIQLPKTSNDDIDAGRDSTPVRRLADPSTGVVAGVLPDIRTETAGRTARKYYNTNAGTGVSSGGDNTKPVARTGLRGVQCADTRDVPGTAVRSERGGSVQRYAATKDVRGAGSGDGVAGISANSASHNTTGEHRTNSSVLQYAASTADRTYIYIHRATMGTRHNARTTGNGDAAGCFRPVWRDRVDYE